MVQAKVTAQSAQPSACVGGETTYAREGVCFVEPALGRFPGHASSLGVQLTSWTHIVVSLHGGVHGSVVPAWERSVPVWLLDHNEWLSLRRIETCG